MCCGVCEPMYCTTRSKIVKYERTGELPGPSGGSPVAPAAEVGFHPEDEKSL